MLWVSAAQWRESARCTHVSPPSWASFLPTSPSHPLGHHRAPSWAPCAVQQLCTSYLLYTWYCAYINTNLPVPTPLPPRVHKSILYVCISVPTLQIGSSVPFFSEKAMAPHSSTLAWKIPWTEEPGRLQSMGSQRVGHDWATSLSLFTFMHWRRKWQPTPVFLPGESQG